MALLLCKVLTAPQLVEHDLDDILAAGPVRLPVTRTGLQGRHALSPDRGHTNRLIGNQEAYQAVNDVIAQIVTPDTAASISALTELDELMKDNEKVELLGPCIDHLFAMCYRQYKHTLSIKMKVDTRLSYIIMDFWSLAFLNIFIVRLTMQTARR